LDILGAVPGVTRGWGSQRPASPPRPVLIGDHERILAINKPVLEGPYEYYRRAGMLGREPA
jgi:hypothetical protein